MNKLTKSKYPKLLKQWDSKKNKFEPDFYNISSREKVWWLCEKSHSFESQIRHRVNGSNCPICVGRKTDKKNNLKTQHPKVSSRWDYSKNLDRPEDVVSGSHSKRWWLCENKHSFEATIRSQVNGHQCGYCLKKFASSEYNLKVVEPKVAKFWNQKKNIESIENVTPYSKKKFHWKCKFGHEWIDSPYRFSRIKPSCPFCNGVRVDENNNLKSLFPDLIKNEWDYTKNKINPKNIKPGSNTKYWWKCRIHNYSWLSDPYSRAIKKYKCIYCSGQKASKTKNLKTDNPKLAKEWNYKKNLSTPEKFTAASTKEVWWKCSNHHEWIQSIHSRAYGKPCPFCNNSRPHEKHNLKFYFPEIAKEWDISKNINRPDEYLPQSRHQAWWICKLGHSWKQKIVNRTPSLNGNKPGTGCPYCTLTPRSREEVFLLFEFKQFFNIDENDHKIKLKRVEDVDIKLANEKVVIEYDGAYWHRDKAERDKAKTKALEKAGWTVIRVREKPLKVLSRKYNVSSKTGEYKETANKVLKKLNQLGYEVKGLDKYLQRKTLVNKKESEKYIDKLLKEKNKK